MSRPAWLPAVVREKCVTEFAPGGKGAILRVATSRKAEDTSVLPRRVTQGKEGTEGTHVYVPDTQGQRGLREATASVPVMVSVCLATF